MAFQGISFRHTLACLVLKIMFLYILINHEKHKMHVQQLLNVAGLGERFYCSRSFYQKHEMESNCLDSFYNFQNIEIPKVVTFH